MTKKTPKTIYTVLQANSKNLVMHNPMVLEKTIKLGNEHVQLCCATTGTTPAGALKHMVLQTETQLTPERAASQRTKYEEKKMEDKLKAFISKDDNVVKPLTESKERTQFLTDFVEQLYRDGFGNIFTRHVTDCHLMIEADLYVERHTFNFHIAI